MKLLLCLAVLCLSVAPRHGLEFDCSAEHLEQCTQDLLKYSREDVPVPENEDQVRESCGIIKNGTRCIRRYMGNCAPPGIRQMGKMALGGVTRAINKRCSADGIKDFLAHRDCIVNLKKPAQVCYHTMVKDLNRIIAADTELIHPSICCFISKMHECNAEALKASCKEESRQLYGHETERMVDDMMELICPPNMRWGKADCKAVASKLAEVEVPADENLSILPLIIGLMKKLAD